MPLLTLQNFLEIPAEFIKGKEYLEPTALDKKAGKTGGYYPDFSVWMLALPTLIVEAKEPGVAVQAIHLRILCERLEYLYGVLTVTPIFDRPVAAEIAEVLKRENQQGYIGAFQQARCVERFSEYLKAQHAHLKSAFQEFGGVQTGSSFVIKQIESALRYFKNPTTRSTERNLLDD